jgi:hypothetical protein
MVLRLSKVAPRIAYFCRSLLNQSNTIERAVKSAQPLPPRSGVGIETAIPAVSQPKGLIVIVSQPKDRRIYAVRETHGTNRSLRGFR